MKYKMDVKQIIPGMFYVSSESKTRMSYIVRKNKHGEIECTCPDHIIRGNEKCKHIKLVEISNFEKVVKNELVQLVPKTQG